MGGLEKLELRLSVVPSQRASMLTLPRPSLLGTPIPGSSIRPSLLGTPGSRPKRPSLLDTPGRRASLLRPLRGVDGDQRRPGLLGNWGDFLSPRTARQLKGGTPLWEVPRGSSKEYFV